MSVTDHHRAPESVLPRTSSGSTRRRSRILPTLATLLCTLLASVALTGASAGPAAAAPAAAEECTPWVQVPVTEDPDNDGYVNDRHGRVVAQLQSCVDGTGAPRQWYGRAIYHQYGPDTWPNQSAGIRVRLYDFSGECHGCDILWQTPRIPEPGPGLSIIGERVPLAAGRDYGVDVSITYVNPPNPYWFQTGTFVFSSPT
jgi:hypothetical protein